MKFIFSYLIAFLFLQNSFGFEGKQDEGIIVNLQNTPIDENTEITLDTNWSFYWNELIEPGDFKKKQTFQKITLANWTTFGLPSFGYATYRLQFSIPKERPHSSVYIPAAYASSRLWINGKMISETGHVGISREETLHRRFSQIIPLNTSETEFEIVIQVANFYHSKGGIDKPLILGTSECLQDTKSNRIIADMIYIGCLAFIGFFFLIFFLWYWNKDRAVLYFAILCISLSYMALSDRYAPLAIVFENISWIFLTKIEYLALFLAGTAASLFFNTIFVNFTYKMYSKIIRFSFYILGILAIFLPAPYFTKLILPFLFLMVVNLAYVTFVIMKAIIGKRHESLLLLISMLLGSVIFCSHIFIFLGKSGDTILYVNFGYITVFLLLSMLLMTRFSKSFRELELSKEFELQQKKEISIKSEQLSSMNLELEKNLQLLENKNAELDNFNHIVSHDLKAPLVAVHSLASFIEEDLKNSIDTNTKQHLHLLKERVSKMDALIESLLDYSKIAKGNKRKEMFYLNDLLVEVIDLIDHEKNHMINFPEKNLEIYANKIELERVFQNLISNSIKHNDKDQTVISISATKKDETYLFSVSDNGPGIDKEYHSKIFEIFSQLDVNNETKSTGIGLAIVRKIITENEGVISVSSKKGVGVKIDFSWKI